jgi:hypothetical protein
MLISEFLADFPDLDRDIGQDLAQIARGAVDLDRKARLSIDIGVEKKGARVMVQVNHTTKPPKPDPEAGLYFATERGLSKDDPWQTSIHDIDPETGELRPKEDTTP